MGNGKSPLIALATGGTGGHVFPAQALAEEMLHRGWRVVMYIDRRGLRYAGSMPSAVSVHTVPSATFTRGGLPYRLAMPFRIMAGILHSLLRLVRDRPTVMVGFGGYTTFPPMLAGWLLRIPGFLHEQNNILGLANRVLARLYRTVAAPTKGLAVPSGVRVVPTGNPVRNDVLKLSGTEYTPPGRGKDRILVIGGSQGAGILDLRVPEAVSRLDATLKSGLLIEQQIAGDGWKLGKRYEALGIAHELQPFFTDIAERLASCQLVIARAGASTIAEISCIGRPAILVPLPRVSNDHQAENARVLAKAGAALSIPEHELTPERLSRAIASILTDGEMASRMALSYQSIAITDARVALGDLATAIAGTGA